MKKFLFTALTFFSLAFAGCSESTEVEPKPDYEFEGSTLVFNYTVTGSIAKYIEVIPSTTLPADAGTANISSDGNKHTISIPKIKCPAKFDVVYLFKPKSAGSIEDDEEYTLTTSYDFAITRQFSDGSHVDGGSGSETFSITFEGKDSAQFFEELGTSTFSFKLSSDGYLEPETEN